MESLSPIGFTMLAPFVEVVKQVLVQFVSYLRKMVRNCDCLISSILAWTTVSRIQIKVYIFIKILCRNNFFVEIFIIPPKTRAHADCLIKDSITSISCIAANQTAKTTTSYRITTKNNSSLEPIIENYC
jgi:hypothetical protein